MNGIRLKGIYTTLFWNIFHFTCEGKIYIQSTIYTTLFLMEQDFSILKQNNLILGGNKHVSGY
jgi:hypothetical protein